HGSNRESICYRWPRWKPPASLRASGVRTDASAERPRGAGAEPWRVLVDRGLERPTMGADNERSE
ncbi:MAG: hypothetical protein KDA47_03450, partial [Planctomycetales bacterium]|nr:hypothetical protein [Planctomycetales bacterium]